MALAQESEFLTRRAVVRQGTTPAAHEFGSGIPGIRILSTDLVISKTRCFFRVRKVTSRALTFGAIWGAKHMNKVGMHRIRHGVMDQPGKSGALEFLSPIRVCRNETRLEAGVLRGWDDSYFL